MKIILSALTSPHRHGGPANSPTRGLNIGSLSQLQKQFKEDSICTSDGDSADNDGERICALIRLLVITTQPHGVCARLTQGLVWLVKDSAISSFAHDLHLKVAHRIDEVQSDLVVRVEAQTM